MCSPGAEIVNTIAVVVAATSAICAAVALYQNSKSSKRVADGYELDAFITFHSRLIELIQRFRSGYEGKSDEEKKPWVMDFSRDLEALSLVINEGLLTRPALLEHFKDVVMGYRELAERVIPKQFQDDEFLEQYKKLEAVWRPKFKGDNH